MEEAAASGIVVRRHMAGTIEPVLVDHQALKADRAAGMGLVGADTNLRPQAEAEAVGVEGLLTTRTRLVSDAAHTVGDFAKGVSKYTHRDLSARL